MRRRLAGAIGEILAVALLLASSASGATVGGTGFGGGLEIEASAGEVNGMTIELRTVGAAGTTVSVADSGAPLVAGPGCAAEAATGEVRCTVQGLYIVFVGLGDGDDALAVDNRDPGAQLTIDADDGADTVDVGPHGDVCLRGGSGADRLTITTPSQACTVRGEAGDDELRGSNGYDRLYGGDDADQIYADEGDDYVYGDAGDDTVHGGPGREHAIEGGSGDDSLFGEAGNDAFEDDPGDDLFAGGPGNDRFASWFFWDSGDDAYAGGPGRDRLLYFCPACRITLDGRANDGRADIGEADDVRTEVVSTPSRIPPDPDTEGDPGHNYGSGRDRLIGDAADNVFVAQRGNDLVDGRGGVDRLIAGHGDDLIDAADGVADAEVTCGPGVDEAFVDAADPTEGCERVTVRRG